MFYLINHLKLTRKLCQGAYQANMLIQDATINIFANSREISYFDSVLGKQYEVYINDLIG